MSNLTKGLILVVVILAIGVGLVLWKKKIGGESQASFNSISKAEIEILLADVAKSNPMILKRLKDDPEMKKTQIENLKQLLAFASQAQKEGLTNEPSNKQELDNIRYEVLAVSYDKEINKDKGPMPPFGFITEDQTKAFWDGGPQPGDSRSPEDQFNDFLNAKLEIMRKSSPDMADRQISDDERTQARDIFAKIRIYKGEFDQKSKSGELSPEFINKANLQVKLQQAQFLARLYSEKATEQTKATDEEIAKYIADHPELDPAAKRAKAQGILDRAKAGEDFAALANEFSEDPGNKGTDGAGQGGLYKDIPKGRMVAPFEAAALALEPGQISPELVETDFGYHIIKLERKLGPGAAKDSKDKGKDAKPGAAPPAGDTYDARHILISTGVKDPENPAARDMPVKDFVKNKLETEKEKKLIEDIVAANNIQVPADFDVPEVTDEQIQQMRQKQMPSQMAPPPEADKPGAGKPGAKPDAKKERVENDDD